MGGNASADGGEPPDVDEQLTDVEQRLLDRIEGPLSPGDDPYLVRIRFDGGVAGTNEKVRIVDELLNALDVRNASPPPEELDSSDEVVDVVVVDTVSQDDVVAALAQRDAVDGVAIRELDRGELDVDTGVEVETRSAEEEFRRLRSRYDRGESIDDPDDEFEFVDPEECAFSSGEYEFEELMAQVTDGAGADWSADRVDRSTEPSVLDALCDELASLPDSDPRVVRVRKALAGTEPRRSTEVRVQHLQSRVDTLGAYADAMEAFIDENGSARELLDRYESEVEELRSRVERMRADLDEGETERAALEDRLDDVEEQYASRATLDDELAAVRDEVADVESDLTATADRLESRLDALETTFEDSLASVEDRLDDVEKDVASHRRWREHVSSAFDPGDSSA